MAIEVREVMSLEIQLQSEMRRLHEMCSDLRAAIIATDDGLPLCTSADSLSDVACATAAFLLSWLNTHLGILQAGHAREVMIWTSSGPCYVARIASLPYVIGLFADGQAPAAALRHAGALASKRLVPVLASLAEHPIEPDNPQ
ncbi:hypothetical protein EJP67_29785 [Variovorax guangxiensis]|uniref:Roadblock/LAMTOR2 domain-containing protein n=1 Tax=Variovorax guangxiensis TaxID=1775474 RepID=A0A433MTP9_9BURK|nr:hypothetical protein [Variovorax guangxiensis]RUR71243.1 hypothetical protein EJP67_29785 [Variovorax guangxiensis]